MPRKPRQENDSNDPHKDEQWLQAWNAPEKIDAGRKQVLLNSLHQRIDAYRRKKKLVLFIGVSAAAAVLAAIFIGLPGIGPKPAAAPWQELASAGTAREIRMEDGSILWLAPHSSIRVYPVFAEQRSTELTKGTAFFSVAKDEQHPFSIAVNRQKVTVLGTSFTIHKLDSIDMLLSVKEGKIALDNNSGRLLLTAGQQVSTTGAIDGRVQSVDVTAADWWLQQKVRWHNIALEEILHRIETYYQVKLSYGNINRNMKLTLSWDMTIPLNDNLAVLNSLTGYHIH